MSSAQQLHSRGWLTGPGSGIHVTRHPIGPSLMVAQSGRYAASHVSGWELHWAWCCPSTAQELCWAWQQQHNPVVLCWVQRESRGRKFPQTQILQAHTCLYTNCNAYLHIQATLMLNIFWLKCLQCPRPFLGIFLNGVLIAPFQYSVKGQF